MKTQMLKTDLDWLGVKNECRATVHKDDSEKEPSEKFKKSILIAEHSPIRELKFKWRWGNIKSWIATHYVRHHEGIEKWVSTQRTDRTGIDRDNLPQSALVNIDMEANAQALINMSKVRLCYQAAPETREYLEDLKYTLHSIDPYLSNVLVPSCIYRCGCPEMSSCQFFKKWLDTISEGKDPSEVNNMITNIQYRYDAYNEYFYKNYKGEVK